jgi:hypothetical protein
MRSWPLSFAIGCALLLGTLRIAPGADFGREVLPLLRDRCFRCHEGKDNRAGVRLDIKAELLGQTGGAALVVPGNSAQSRLMELVRGTNPNEVMPPKGPRLKAEEIDLLARWIDGGLSWDANLLPERESAADHWAFQPVRRPAVPDGDADGWSRSPVDRFIAAEHHQRGLTPAQAASRRVHVRRLYFDLWGLPPTWDDAQAFLADESPDAAERLVDQLLASPRYGEHEGRLWLDVARWAESEGFESNHPRPSAWRYRDFVAQAFSGDKPFDEFIAQQIAGDELPEYSDENLIATGYLAAARISSNEEDKALQRNDVTVDIVNAVGSGLLGLTLHCAQCHDHKFDPISARDYYSLHAFFARGMPLNAGLRNDVPLSAEEQSKRAEQVQAIALQQTLFEQGRKRLHAQLRSQLSPAEQQIYDLPANERSRDQELQARKISLKFQKSNGEIEKSIDPASRKLYDELKKRTAELEKQLPHVAQTFAFYSPVTSPHEISVLPALGFYPLPYEPEEMRRARNYVLVRGEVHQLGVAVEPAFPQILRSVPGASVPRTRRELAAWLNDSQQPLVPRVWVNRLWQQHFGRGLVATTDDFGLRGARPSHPELLDWLAAEFLRGGRSTKHIHRLIVSSAAYRQGAESSPATLARDADNRWLTRHVPKRLTAEQLRDAWLLVNGELDNRLAGPSVPLDQREASLRRSLYLFQRRGQAPDVQRLFDGPQECSASIARREVTTSPLQSLYLLNSPFAVERSSFLARSIRTSLDEDRDSLIRAAFRRVLLREPVADELLAATQLWQASSQADPLPSVCQALLNLNEFNYVE